MSHRTYCRGGDAVDNEPDGSTVESLLLRRRAARLRKYRGIPARMPSRSRHTSAAG
jgi:hypothetical protein